MHFKISTRVNADLNTVRAGFNEQLFLSLNPPFPRVALEQFDGCKTGDIVTIKLNFLIFKQTWRSLIISDKLTNDEWVFVDKGEKLPFFLKTWNHHHEVRTSGKGSIISDNIKYTTGTLFTDLIMYPLLIGQFLYRKPFYKKAFK